MNHVIFLLLISLCNFVFSADDDFIGHWQGKLVLPGQSLRIVFHISQNDAGEFQATMDSPDQNATGIPVTSVLIDSEYITLTVAMIQGSYYGKLVNGGMGIVGTWTQSGQEFEINLKKETIIHTPVRPQEPKAPFPYLEREVKIKNNQQGNTIAGTLTYPKGKGKYPVLILISGSGAQDRDETVFNHKPFWVIADFLSRNGFAVFRYDDRGVGGSTGRLIKSTLYDLSQDVEELVRFVKTLEFVNPEKVVLLGHSEGGLIASITAAHLQYLSAVILLATPGIPGFDVIVDQVATKSKMIGLDEASICQNVALQKKILTIVRNEPNLKQAAAQLKELVPVEKHRQIGILLSKKYKSMLTLDPETILKNVKCPVIAINGSKDMQVLAKKNLEAIAATLKNSENNNYKTVELEGLNHLFQKAETGAISEYGQIEETIAPEVLKLIRDWLQQNL